MRGCLLVVAVACSAPPAAESTARPAPAPRASEARAVVRACAGIDRGSAAQAIAQTPAPAGGGALSKDEIRGVIRGRLSEVRRCYEDELLKRPSLTGKTTAHFTIAADGSVTRSTADGFDPAVDACVARVMASLRFPPPAGGGIVHVNYPFIFQPAGAAAPAPAADQREAGILGVIQSPGCQVVEPPRALLDRQQELDRCARALAAGAPPVDVEVVLRRGATVSGPEPARGCAARALAAIVEVDPPTTCTVALGDPREMRLEKPAVGAELECPPELR